MRAFHESPDSISLNSHVLTLKVHVKTVVCFCCLLKHFEASLTNSVDPGQTAPIGAFLSGSTLFVFILMSNYKQTLSSVVILLAF